ncbi:MAG: bifunctional salicylyl-CoA 5-hydroxylase/oxidoreductase, partial [Streptomyces sp.]|nr:bifunctional salicylyl-CoA 5-hydroxylase/oxidoreductase [Streptomyces sp.]
MRLRRGARPAPHNPHPQRIAITGGGPGGLYAAALLKGLDPNRQVTVWERNAPGDTFGFGVFYAALQPHFTRWNDIHITHRGTHHTSGGHGFAA